MFTALSASTTHCGYLLSGYSCKKNSATNSGNSPAAMLSRMFFIKRNWNATLCMVSRWQQTVWTVAMLCKYALVYVSHVLHLQFLSIGWKSFPYFLCFKFNCPVMIKAQPNLCNKTKSESYIFFAAPKNNYSSPGGKNTIKHVHAQRTTNH